MSNKACALVWVRAGSRAGRGASDLAGWSTMPFGRVDRLTDSLTHSQTDRHTDKQTDRKRDRDRDRDRDRQTTG